MFLAGAILLAYSHSAWAMYGPSLTRTDPATELRACQEAKFSQSQQIIRAMSSRDYLDIARVLGGALAEIRATPSSSPLYPARAFCVHELVPDRLPPEGNVSSHEARQPTVAVRQFHEIDIDYFYYDPDGEWVLQKDPVDLDELAEQHLDSRWGRQAFLMMTRLGWSRGACTEGPDQFREVIRHGEAFLHAYPRSEVSDSIRLELARAYETWWNLSLPNAGEPGNEAARYKAGASTAKQRGIELYQEYLSRQKTAAPEARERLKALQENSKGSKHYDYFCEDYED